VTQTVAACSGVHGVHVAHVVINGVVDSPGTMDLTFAQRRPELQMDTAAVSETFYQLHARVL